MRGAVKYYLGDKEGACLDLDLAIGYGHEEAERVYSEICH